MKVCSICKRQYADSLKFCLDDGTVLTDAPELDATLIDPQATLRLHARETDPRPVALNHTKPLPWIAIAAISIVVLITVVGVAALFLINSATRSSNESTSNTSSAQSSTQTPSPDATAEVLSAEDAVDAALLQGDADALSRLLADDYRFVSDLGVTANKLDLLTSMRTGNLSYDSRTTSDRKVEVTSDKAELTGHATARGQWQRRRFNDSTFYRNTYVRRDGRWQLVSGTAWHRQ